MRSNQDPGQPDFTFINEKMGELTLVLDGLSSSALSMGNSSTRPSGGAARTERLSVLGDAAQESLREVCLMWTPGESLWQRSVNKQALGIRGRPPWWAKKGKGEEQERNEKQGVQANSKAKPWVLIYHCSGG